MKLARENQTGQERENQRRQREAEQARRGQGGY